MAIIVRRLLSLLFRLKFYSKHYKIVYEGKVSSMNAVWQSAHWSQRSAAKNKYAKIFTILLLEAKVKPLVEMSIVMFYNSRIDVDNGVMGCKILADCIKGSYIEDDSSKFYKALFMVHDPKLAKNTYEYHIIGK